MKDISGYPIQAGMGCQILYVSLAVMATRYCPFTFGTLQLSFLWDSYCIVIVCQLLLHFLLYKRHDCIECRV